jgi:Asp-tRNA(Asn)/Glu-tRNA(Gln) amidotransferase A subunit family amidase
MLHGIPVLIKDNYNTTDLPTTGGSVALADFRPTANATQVNLLIEAGAIILGKTNLHEFAYGITSVSSMVGQTRNPYDPRRVPGGSSGGTAAAIAANFAAVGMGSDTCGSIRIPSAFNNLAGLRPSKGLGSIFGIMPLSHTQDVAGPLARGVHDLAIVLDVISGFDPNDGATAIVQNRQIESFEAGLGAATLDGLRIGKLSAYFERANNEVREIIEDRMEQMQQLGVEFVDVDIPELPDMLSNSGLIGYEFREDLNDYLNVFGAGEIDELAEIVNAALHHQAVTAALSRSASNEFEQEAYQTAYANRQVLRDAIEATMDSLDLDAMIYPPIGEQPVFTGESQPGNNCSISANSGLPAMSIPAGLSALGLPVGMELLGGFLTDVTLVSIAYQLEQALPWRQLPPTTPALVEGMPPPVVIASAQLNQAGIELTAEISYDQSTSLLSYRLTNASSLLDQVYAVNLAIRTESGAVDNPVIVHTLMGPGWKDASGELYTEPEVRSAVQQGRASLRVFASGLPVEGAILPLRFSQ